MNPLSFISKKLKAPRLLQPASTPFGSFRINRSHPHLHGCLHWWDGLRPAGDGVESSYITDIPDLIGDIPQSYLFRSGLPATWDPTEGSIQFTEASHSSYFRNTALWEAAGELTLSGWFKMDRAFSTATDKMFGVFGWGEHGSDEILLKIVESNTDSRIEFYFTVTSGASTSEAIVYMTLAEAAAYEEGWVHFAGVFSGAEVPKLFLQGELQTVDSSSSALTTSPSGNDYYMMGRAWPGAGGSPAYWGFPGQIRDCRMYEVAVPDALIADMTRNEYACLDSPMPAFFPATFIHSSFVFDPGTYIIAGSDLGLLVDREFAIDAGSYAVTGNDIALTRQFLLSIASGEYTITPADIGLLKQSLLQVDAGVYTITGNSLTFTYIKAAEPGLIALVVEPDYNTLSIRDLAETLA